MVVLVAVDMVVMVVDMVVDMVVMVVDMVVDMVVLVVVAGVMAVAGDLVLYLVTYSAVVDVLEDAVVGELDDLGKRFLVSSRITLRARSFWTIPFIPIPE